MFKLLRGASWPHVAYWIGKKGHRAWQRLDAEDRNQLQSLLTKSRGRYSNLEHSERDEVSRIVRKARGKDGR